MANTNLAHHEQILKSFEQSLKNIGDQHKLMLESFKESMTHDRLTSNHMEESWSQIVNLFVKIEQLRQSRLELE